MPTASTAGFHPADAPVTRDRILDTAEALFAQRGFAGTSVRDIASSVGLTAASLYNHFPSKDALYAAVLERGIRPLIELLRDSASGPPAPDAAEQVVAAVMEHLASRPHLPRLIYHEVVAGGGHIAELTREWVAPALAHGLAEMNRERDDMPWSPDEYPLVISAWIHLVLGPFALAPLYGGLFDEDPLSPAMLERQTRFLRKLARMIANARPDELQNDD